jgi:ribonuclease D
MSKPRVNRGKRNDKKKSIVTRGVRHQQGANKRPNSHTGSTERSPKRRRMNPVLDSAAAHYAETVGLCSTKEEREAFKKYTNRLPVITWGGQTKVLNTIIEMEQAVQDVIDSGEMHLGFDVETKPCFRKGQWNPPALVQIATADCVYLFRVCKLRTIATLVPLLEHQTIIKTGVGIQGDINELLKVIKFTPGGFEDIAKISKDKLQIEMGGLRSLTAYFLKGRLTKGAQMSNWAQESLTPKQIEYAATDAWVGRQVYQLAKEAWEAKKKTPPTLTNKGIVSTGVDTSLPTPCQC